MRKVHVCILGLILPLYLSGCVTRYTVVPPSPELTKDCGYPVLTGDTWRDLAEAYAERGAALKECNNRMEALRRE